MFGKFIKNNNGQSLLEASFVLLFTSVVMFAFLQICIMVVDDMSINEAAFTAIRSAAVTKSRNRAKESENRVEKYVEFFYPKTLGKDHFVFSNSAIVDKYFHTSSTGVDEEGESTEPSDTGKSITLWKGTKTIKDFSGKSVAKQTVKIYYFTKTIFSSWVAKFNSSKGNRYQSARSRLFPSPDEDYYYKAFPTAFNFDV
ncbi:MAG: hypothetical protein LBU55_05410 [Elusimicrobiota bacterium]|jgi:Na+-transporting methylmalonyl-CoA/oxaloacetate decarboxylase gamma subunit|nr:hypothetical protein [Elusimicrobiota bacterium]